MEINVHRAFSDCHDNPVYLTEACWFDHILVEHPEMDNEEESVQLTLRDPDFRTRNPAFPNREIFYRTCQLRLVPDAIVKVVVAFEPSELGFARGTLITAFPATSIRQGEDLLWKRNS
jgi:hypothetical protein